MPFHIMYKYIRRQSLSNLISWNKRTIVQGARDLNEKERGWGSKGEVELKEGWRQARKGVEGLRGKLKGGRDEDKQGKGLKNLQETDRVTWGATLLLKLETFQYIFFQVLIQSMLFAFRYNCHYSIKLFLCIFFTMKICIQMYMPISYMKFYLMTSSLKRWVLGKYI